MARDVAGRACSGRFGVLNLHFLNGLRPRPGDMRLPKRAAPEILKQSATGARRYPAAGNQISGRPDTLW